MKLFVLDDSFSICRFTPDSEMWKRCNVSSLSFISITRTRDELSIVCRSDIVPPDATRRSDGWRCIGVEGPLDFSLTGVLSSLLAPLAAAKISVFTVSTFDTDYVLVPEASLRSAIDVLTREGYVVRHI